MILQIKFGLVCFYAGNNLFTAVLFSMYKSSRFRLVLRTIQVVKINRKRQF